MCAFYARLVSRNGRCLTFRYLGDRKGRLLSKQLHWMNPWTLFRLEIDRNRRKPNCFKAGSIHDCYVLLLGLFSTRIFQWFSMVFNHISSIWEPNAGVLLCHSEDEAEASARGTWASQAEETRAERFHERDVGRKY